MIEDLGVDRKQRKRTQDRLRDGEQIKIAHREIPGENLSCVFGRLKVERDFSLKTSEGDASKGSCVVSILRNGSPGIGRLTRTNAPYSESLSPWSAATLYL